MNHRENCTLTATSCSCAASRVLVIGDRGMRGRGLMSHLMLSALAQGLAAVPEAPRRRMVVIDEVGPYPPVLRPAREKSPADLERLAAAQAKRERRAAKRGQR